MILYVGIDFSLNFTGVTVLYNNETSHLSVTRGDNFTKKQKDLINQAEQTTNYKNLIVPKPKFSNDYSSDEVLRVLDATNISNIIIKELLNYEYDELVVSIEGFSYSSLGQRALELGGYQYILRKSLYDIGANLNVYSPGTIKKTAGKGNFKKYDMLVAYLKDKNDYIFKNFILNNIELININLKVMEPFCGIIDSFWVLQTLLKDKNIF